ncbi:galactokinase [[Clostridium] polysaccharolyticum]|uniref:Galactokinase n=1 Tax=[Clostridium] polysaccharolyticum TaxID=29364 RepID=A0A1I0FL23_9FIRM|nr:galactokinase [[Clostridium] polysaccharolyticum]SET59064.1 galactokinase [[Clostridium] polysaccharolyticum]
MRAKVLEEFKKKFGDNEGNIRVFFAPGRVNLIGEHTDYNGGHVFPCALTIGTYAVIRKRQDEIIRLYSMNFVEDGIMETTLQEVKKKQVTGWTGYPAGIVWSLFQKEFQIDKGFDVLYYGNIPNGSGLSSSASIEVVTVYALSKVFEFALPNIEIAKISQFSENQYNQVNCGIMDQFAVAMGKENQAIYLDTATLEYRYAPIRLDDEKIVIMNTNKRRELGDSKYNQRRMECQKALEMLQSVRDIQSLGELTCEEFEESKEVITDMVLRKRAKHAVYENQRTMAAVDALEEKDLVKFGQFMVESHNSLRDDYEVTGVELDTLVEETLKCNGVIGARMTGAGFGGCAVSIVKNDAVKDVIEAVGENYKKRIGYAADFYVVSVGDGPKEL